MKAKSASVPPDDVAAGEASPASARPGTLSEAEKLDRLRLIRAENVGSITFWTLLEEFGSASKALAALPELARRGGRRSGLRIPGKAEAQAEMEKAHAIGSGLFAHGEDGYPPLLARVEAPPPLLYQKGRPTLWQQPAIAIVGARNASAAGMRFASLLAMELGSAGIAVVSGLARGIDAAAHKASLTNGTAAVTAGGIDVIYPPEHAALHAQICEAGVVVSECPPGFQPRAQDFPRRNRIISGCSLGTIVVEAAERSGSLITARTAAEQNREVFAVPGHPLDPRAQGPNKLLKSGATLITSAEDILIALRPLLRNWPECLSDMFPAPQSGRPGGFLEEGDPFVRDYEGGEEDSQAIVRNVLQSAPVSIDDIVRATGLSARAVNIALIELDLAGAIERHGRQMVSLRIAPD